VRPKETGPAYQEDNHKIAQNTLTDGKKITGKQQRLHHHHQQLRKAKTISPQKKKPQSYSALLQLDHGVLNSPTNKQAKCFFFK
jgi:hypothetical protein